jgi:aminoglycoside/choline kinase family phosphotransferase
MADRQALIDAFLVQEGWADARRTALTGDASFRRYHRLADNGRQAMLMDAPPPQENIGPFLAIARHLTGLGYSAPEILAEDRDAGFILLEDFGDSTFTRLLAAGVDETSLYNLATDVLIDLHKKPAAEAIPEHVLLYDSGMLLAEAALLTDWFVPAARGKELSASDAQEYQALWSAILSLPNSLPETLVLRDYHVDNLMRLDGRAGIAACGLLDFQDAVAGPVTYDLVSLIEDARRDITPGTAAAVRARYLAAFPDFDRDDFDRSMAVHGAQRHAKVIGIFTRLCVRDGKPIYLDHIPRVWRLLEAACQHPALAVMKEWLDDHIPVELRGVPEGLRVS